MRETKKKRKEKWERQKKKEKWERQKKKRKVRNEKKTEIKRDKFRYTIDRYCFSLFRKYKTSRRTIYPHIQDRAR